MFIIPPHYKHHGQLISNLKESRDLESAKWIVKDIDRISRRRRYHHLCCLGGKKVEGEKRTFIGRVPKVSMPRQGLAVRPRAVSKLIG